ncbi:MAG: amino acid ABC transporter permease [Alphaproteobacteria bacterium]|nr:amino acid ABC transporter permease [Alphaproteobacteria bacterium]
MAVQDTSRHEPQRSSFLNDPVVRGRLYQLLTVVIVAAFVWFIADNTAANLARQNKTTGFDFFWFTSGFDIQFSLIPYSRASTYGTAFLVGILNTMLVAVIGVFFASLLGFMVGIARLSNNFIISRLALIYVETLRNVPLLLQLVFWYFAVLKSMPGVRQSFIFLDGVVLNQRGLYLPKVVTDAQFAWVWGALALSIVAIVVLQRWAHKRLEATGQRFPVFWTALGVLVVLPLVAGLISGTHLSVDLPVLKGFNYAGGIGLPPELVALCLGLIFYTATFISEIVRAGIQSVSYGQTEAAQALGLRDGDRLRLVIIPQAMRVIIPPLASQYLNLTKNSSLAIAIGYPDLVSVFMNTTLNQTGRAIEVVFITMLVYLTLSLATSSFMNWYNRRIALVER